MAKSTKTELVDGLIQRLKGANTEQEEVLQVVAGPAKKRRKKSTLRAGRMLSGRRQWGRRFGYFAWRGAS